MEANREVRAAFWVTAGGRHGGGNLSRSMALIDELPDNWNTVLVLPDNEYTRALHSVGGPAVAFWATSSTRMTSPGLVSP